MSQEVEPQQGESAQSGRHPFEAPRAIPVNLITGLLGVGKTSALRHLLSQVPAGERWAVVVNEFGELGIDAGWLDTDASTPARETATVAGTGSVTASGPGQQAGVAIREVPGGCLCCTAQAGLRVALTQLLREAHPDRVLIEPSGVGHPTGIIDILRAPPLAQALSVQAVVCLLDPRQYTPARLAGAQVYVDQLTLADVLVINKTDLASPDELETVRAAARAMYPPRAAIVETTGGVFDPALLDVLGEVPGAVPATPRVLPPRPSGHEPPDAHHVHSAPAATRTAVPGLGVRVTRSEAGYWVVGWYAGPDVRFQRRRLQALFAGLGETAQWGLPPVVRAKGVLRTGRDWQLLNWSGDALALRTLAWRRDNRLELILRPLSADAIAAASAPHASLDWSAFEQALRACQVSESPTP